MVYTMDVKQEYVSYTARFASPAFDLWGAGGKIARGLYEAFLPFGVPLANIQLNGSASNAAEPVVTVKIGDSGTCKFAFDRIESVFVNFSEQLFQSVPKMLEASTVWIRGTLPSLTFASHQIVYFNHSLLKEIKVEEFLNILNPKTIEKTGRNIGNGMIFNQVFPDLGWQTQFVVDLSATIPGGLFVSFAIALKTDKIDYDKIMVQGREYFSSQLQEIGLRISEPYQ
jgi:hypothetical protein